MNLFFFWRLVILRANQLFKSLYLVLAIRAQLCLDQSDSEILKSVVTQEKYE